VYRDIIKHVYTEVSAILSFVKGREWLNRTVLAEGVILNEYSEGIKIIINYTDSIFTYAGLEVNPQAAALIYEPITEANAAESSAGGRS